jgi:DNA-binding protein HU-beta
MNKQDLINAIVEKQPDLTKKAAGEALDTVLDSIGNALAKGDVVQLIGFGTFNVRATAARTARNPRTGDPIEIKAGKKVGFKVGKALKDRVA